MAEIIAEIGSNWSTFEQAKDSISMAKNCGADAVKFQYYTSYDLYGSVADKAWYVPDAPQGEGQDYGSKCKYEMPKDWLPKLKEKADAVGIEFMCTAFSEGGIEVVDPYVKRHKIASSDLTHLPMLVTAKETGKPILLSTGASGWQDIANALEVLKGADVTLMYCNSEYPSKWHNLKLINVLRDKFNVDVGYSDHSIDGYTPSCAVHLHGASIVEKHANFVGLEGTPDAEHSVDPKLFKYMVDCIKDPNNAMKMPTPGEVDMIKRHNRRMVVTAKVKAGEQLKYGENYGLYRVLKDDVNGWSGWQIKHVDGKTAAMDLKPGDTIGPSQVVI